MGSVTFFCECQGRTPDSAFKKAVKQARYNYGHAGYTGTIAEKSSFVLIDLPKGESATKFADSLIDASDPRINDKWGPAGCIKLGAGNYLFFGWASQ